MFPGAERKSSYDGFDLAPVGRRVPLKLDHLPSDLHFCNDRGWREEDLMGRKHSFQSMPFAPADAAVR
jgi:hypothetical protein